MLQPAPNAAYTQPVYMPQYPMMMVAKEPGNGLGIGGMVCGIIALVAFWVPVFGVIIAVVGFLLSVAGMVRSCNRGVPKGQAIAGLVCSIIALIPALFMILVLGAYTFW